MDLEVLRYELEQARRERAVLLEQASALEPHLQGALVGMHSLAGGEGPPLYQSHARQQRLNTAPSPAGPRKLSWGSKSPARARPAPRPPPTATSPSFHPPSEPQQQQQQQQRRQSTSDSEQHDLQAASEPNWQSSGAGSGFEDQTSDSDEDALPQQEHYHPRHQAASLVTASAAAFPAGQGQEAVRKQAFKEVLALLLGEGPGSSKLDHMQLNAATVVAVAREAASSAAAEARRQAEQAAAAGAQDRISKAVKEATERAQREAAQLQSGAQAAQATLSTQVSKLQAQVDALQKEKRALEGKAAQQGRDARVTAEGLKAVRDQAAAAEKAAERRGREAAKAQAEAQRDKQEAERRAREAELRAGQAEVAMAEAQKAAAAAEAESRKAAKRAEAERTSRLAAEASAKAAHVQLEAALAAAIEAQQDAVRAVTEADARLVQLRGEVSAAMAEAAGALLAAREEAAQIRQEAAQQLEVARQQISAAVAAAAAASADTGVQGGPQRIAALEAELQLALTRCRELEIRVQVVEAAKGKLAAEKGQLDAELRMLTKGQADMRRELASSMAALSEARAAAASVEARATEAEARAAAAAGVRVADAEARAQGAQAEAEAAWSEAAALRAACLQAEALQHEAEARLAQAEAAAEEQHQRLTASAAAMHAAEAAADARAAALVRSLRSRYFRDPAPSPEPTSSRAVGQTSTPRGAKGPGRPPSCPQRSSVLPRPSTPGGVAGGCGVGGGPLERQRLSPTPEGGSEEEASGKSAASAGLATAESSSSTLSTLCRLGADEVMEALEAFIGRQAAALERQAGGSQTVGPGQGPDGPGVQAEDQQVGLELLWLEGCLLLALAELRQQEREAEALRQQLHSTLSTPGQPGGASGSSQLRLNSARSARGGTPPSAAGLDAAGSGVGGSPARSLAAQMMRAMAAERTELQRRVARLEASVTQTKESSSVASTGYWAATTSSAHGHPHLHQARDPGLLASPAMPFTHYMPLRRSLSARSAASAASSQSAPQSPGLATAASISIGGPSNRDRTSAPPAAPGQAPELPSLSGASHGPPASVTATPDKPRRCSESASPGSPSLHAIRGSLSPAGMGGVVDAADVSAGTPRRMMQGCDASVGRAWAEGSEVVGPEEHVIPMDGGGSRLHTEGSARSLASSSTASAAPGRAPHPAPGSHAQGVTARKPLQPGHGRQEGGPSSSPFQMSYDVDDVMAILEGLGDVLPSAQQGHGGNRTQQQYKPVGLAGSLLGPSPSVLQGRQGGRPRFGAPAWDGTMQVLNGGEGGAYSSAGVGLYGKAAAGRGSLLVGGRGSGSRQLTPYLSKLHMRTPDSDHS